MGRGSRSVLLGKSKSASAGIFLHKETDSFGTLEVWIDKQGDPIVRPYQERNDWVKKKVTAGSYSEIFIYREDLPRNPCGDSVVVKERYTDAVFSRNSYKCSDNNTLITRKSENKREPVFETRGGREDKIIRQWEESGSVYRRVETRNNAFLLVEHQTSKDGKPHSIDGKPAYKRIEKGSVTEERRYINGLLQSIDDQPSLVEYKDNQVLRRIWHSKGVIHREHLPAVFEYEEDKLTVKFYSEGELVNMGGDAAISVWRDDILLRKEYREGDAVFNPDGPAIIEYYDEPGERIIRSETHSKKITVNGVEHVVPGQKGSSGPYLIEYAPNGVVDAESWMISKNRKEFINFDFSANHIPNNIENRLARRTYVIGDLRTEEYIVDNQYHRTDGPACVKYDFLSGEPKRFFFLHGKKYSESYWKRKRRES